MDSLGGPMLKNVSAKQLWRGIPLGRCGTKKEIADALLFLCSDAAAYITGEMLVVDGGQWLMSGGQRGNMYFENPAVKQMITGMKSKRKKQSKL